MKHINILVLTVIFATFNVNSCLSQNLSENKNSHAFYVEALGPAMVASVNYEFGFLFDKERSRSMISGRIGIGQAEFSTYVRKNLILGASANLGRNKNFYQLSLNRIFEENVPGTAVGMAYVRRPPEGLYLHLSFLVIIFDEEQPFWDGSIKVWPWAGLGVGMAF